MKTRHIASLFAIAALAASSAFAGPDLQSKNAQRDQTQKETQAVTPEDTTALGCANCKTVAITQYKTPLPNGRGTPRWTKVGTKHTCDNAKGEITIAKRKTTDTMQHHHSKCGDDAGSAPAKEDGHEHKH